MTKNLKIFNTLSGKKDLLKPRTGKKINLFVCGPTVYDYATIGNLASYIYWDTLVRILMANDFEILSTLKKIQEQEIKANPEASKLSDNLKILKAL